MSIGGWILFFAWQIGSSAGQAGQVGPFNDQESCQRAAAQVIATLGKPQASVSCIPARRT